MDVAFDGATVIYRTFDAEPLTGPINAELLDTLPKSIKFICYKGAGYDPIDVQSTLMDFTARSIVDAIDRFCAATEEIYLAGGGARNAALVKRIAALARGRPVATTDALGVPTGHVESMAFAWLAMKCIGREPVDLTAVTGAREPRVLGAIYAA